jgi:hypothetical protein
MAAKEISVKKYVVRLSGEERERSGSRNLHRGYEWNFCLNAA